MVMGVSFSGRKEVAWLLIGEMAYVYYVVMRLRKGLPRLLALLVVLVPSLIVPWRAPTAAERILQSFLFLWMIMSKLLLLAWDIGPAADPVALSSFPRFFSALTFSLHLERDQRYVRKSPEQAAIENSNGAESKSTDPVQNGLVRRKTGDSSGKENGSGAQERAAEKVQPKYSSWFEMAANSQAGQIVALRSVFYFVVAALLLRIVISWKDRMNIYLLDFLLGWFMYFSCLFLFEATAGIPACIFGLELQPQFNMPFLADSLADFWGRRWNLLVNNLLRVSVFEPTLRLLSPGDNKPAKRYVAIATLASFLVSGLMHETIFFYSNQSGPTWEMTTFFLLNGLGTIVERIILTPSRRKRVPRFLRRTYTMVFVYLMSCWFFFPPLFGTGMVDECLEDLRQFVVWVVGLVTFQK